MKAGLGALRKNKTERPKKIVPKQSAENFRTLPSDQILVKPTRRLTQKDTPKSVQMQVDTHAAIKEIASVENKKLYEVINEITEKYIKEMPEQSKKLIVEKVRFAQQSMPNMD